MRPANDYKTGRRRQEVGAWMGGSSMLGSAPSQPAATERAGTIMGSGKLAWVRGNGPGDSEIIRAGPFGT